MKSWHRIVTAMAIVFTLLAAGCGDDDGSSADSGDQPDDATDADGAFPVTVQTDSGEITIEERPVSIVSVSPTGTEMLYAIGAGDQVVAVDQYSYYPEGTPVTDLSGYQPNVEAIAGYDPDLVVLSNDPGDVVDGLAKLGIPAIHLDSAADLDGTYAQIEVLGAATGHVGDAAELVAQMQTDVDEIVASLPDDLPEGTYYHELGPEYYSITSDTFIGEMYRLLGLTSIGDAVEGAADSGGYPQLNSEFIVSEDPDFIFLADAQCCDQSPETIAARPGWNTMSAVVNDRVIIVDEDIASRWGPRIVDFLREVADAVSATATTG